MNVIYFPGCFSDHGSMDDSDNERGRPAPDDIEQRCGLSHGTVLYTVSRKSADTKPRCLEQATATAVVNLRHNTQWQAAFNYISM